MANRKILVVEDNKRQSGLIVDALRQTGFYEPIAAYNGQEALQTIRRHRRGFGFLANEIGCILLDWQMPVFSGEAFLQSLRTGERANPFKQHIPVIIISAFSDLNRRQLAENPVRGLVCDYLVKPFELKELLHLVYRITFLNEAEVLREMFTEKRARWRAEHPESAFHGQMIR